MANNIVFLPVGSLLFFDITPDYAAGTTYALGDKVYYGGTLWRYKYATPASGQTPVVGSYWEVSTDPIWQKITEHNRQPMEISTNRIENTKRMSNGSLRKYFIADKKAFSVSWDMLPSFSTLTVDGAYGAVDIKDYYGSSKGQSTFKIKLVYGKKLNGQNIEDRYDTYTVNFTQCNLTLVKRNVKGATADPAQEFWSLSIAMEEV
jgi:hypothetical protein